MVGIGIKLFRLSNSGISKNQICCPSGFDNSICPEGNLLNLTTVPRGEGDLIAPQWMYLHYP